GVPAAHAAGVGAADGAGRRGGGDRQVDGELLDIETGADEAAPFGSAQQFERKHQEAPGALCGTGSALTGYPLLRPPGTESAGEPLSGTVSWELSGTLHACCHIVYRTR